MREVILYITGLEITEPCDLIISKSFGKVGDYIELFFGNLVFRLKQFEKVNLSYPFFMQCQKIKSVSTNYNLLYGKVKLQACFSFKLYNDPLLGSYASYVFRNRCEQIIGIKILQSQCFESPVRGNNLKGLIRECNPLLKVLKNICYIVLCMHAYCVAWGNLQITYRSENYFAEIWLAVKIVHTK